MGDRYRYTGGQHRRADGEIIPQGGTFEPTDHELDTIGERGHLEPVSESAPFAGADIGLRSLDWGSEAALQEALEASLEVEDFEDIEPSGVNGYIMSDVTAAKGA